MPAAPLPRALGARLLTLLLGLGLAGGLLPARAAPAPEAGASAPAAKPARPARKPAAPKPPPLPMPEDSQHSLPPGAQLILPAGGKLARVAVGQEAVADVTPLRDDAHGDHVLVRTRAVGRTEVLIWRRGTPQPARHLIEVTARVDGLELKPDGQGALRVEGGSPGLVERAQAFRALQKASGLKDSLPDASQVQLRPSTVQVDVKVVEFSRSSLREIGLNLFTNRVNNNGFSFGLFTPSTLGTLTQGPAFDPRNPSSAARLSFSNSRAPFTDAFNLAFGRRGLVGTLSLLEANGLARVLAEPSLTALSGQHASFLAGGEIPVPVPQGLGSVAIEYKSFGIGLTVSPTVLGEDRIVLKVAPEASDLDFSNGLQLNGALVPAILTRRADTTVEMGDGESFVIGGLVNSATTSAVDKLPLLGDLPILGSFFKTTRAGKEERELLIVVTPRLVRPIARGAELPPLPGASRERSQASTFQHHLLGPHLVPEVVPGFSR